MRPQRGASRSFARQGAVSRARLFTASLIEGGAEVDIVWDVFTPDKKGPSG